MRVQPRQAVHIIHQCTSNTPPYIDTQRQSWLILGTASALPGSCPGWSASWTPLHLNTSFERCSCRRRPDGHTLSGCGAVPESCSSKRCEPCAWSLHPGILLLQCPVRVDDVQLGPR
eukprot:scaffold49_cov409-Prasinococcus_capsulatus_cf.AAC.2